MRRAILVYLVAQLNVALHASGSACAEEVTLPFRAYVAVPSATIRSGPAQEYYVTGALPQDALVEVYQQSPGGWLGILPPQGSYCWVFGRHLELLDEKSGRINKDGVPARIAGQRESERQVIQVRLNKNDHVQVLGQEQQDGQVWYKIAPPAGEYRWMRIHELEIRPSAGQVKIEPASDERRPPPREPRPAFSSAAPAIGSGRVTDRVDSGRNVERESGAETEAAGDSLADNSSGWIVSASHEAPVTPAVDSEFTEPLDVPTTPSIEVAASPLPITTSPAVPGSDTSYGNSPDPPPLSPEYEPSRHDTVPIRSQPFQSESIRPQLSQSQPGQTSEPARELSTELEPEGQGEPGGNDNVAPGRGPAVVEIQSASSPPTGVTSSEMPSRTMDDRFAKKLVALELEISQTIADDRRNWQLALLESRAEELLGTAQTVSEREAGKRILKKIDRFASIQRRFQRVSSMPSAAATVTHAPATTHFAPPVYPSPPTMAISPLPPFVTPTGESSPTAAAPAPLFGARPRPTAESSPALRSHRRHDAVGILRPVVSRQPSAPRYALVDPAGRIVSFVTPTPDVDIEEFLGQRVGVAGEREYLPEFRRTHVTAGRVIPLVAPLRR